MQKFIFIITFILFVIGFLPYKFPHSPKNISENELIVKSPDYTCSPDFEIVKGKLGIPEKYKELLKGDSTDINIVGNNSPLESMDTNGRNYFLITENQFIITGKVFGVDSPARTCEKIALFKIDNWVPTNYHPVFWTFNVTVVIVYLIILFLLILTSILIFIGSIIKNKQK